jgi:hypothetical protein
MYRWTQDRRLMTAVFAVFAAMGVVLLAVGSESQRIFGLVAIIMFGGAGAAWFVGEYVSPRAPAPRIGEVRGPDGTRVRGLIIPVREGKLRAGLIAQACIALASLVLVIRPDALGPRYAGAQVLFVVIVVVLIISITGGLRGWRDREALIAVTPVGIHSQSLGGRVLVPWSTIVRVVPVDLYGQPFLGIDVADRGAIERRGGGAILGMLDRPLAGHDQTLSLVGIRLPPEEVLRLVAHYHEHPESRGELTSSAGWTPVVGAGAPPT